jgi:hypothetical protein
VVLGGSIPTHLDHGCPHSSGCQGEEEPRKERVARDLDGYMFPALPRKWADDTGSEEMKEWLAKFAEDRALGKSDRELGLNV